MAPPANRSFEQRLARAMRGEDECWLWDGGTRRGYGRVHWRGRYWPAHRAVYTHLVGPVPGDRVLDHLCRVRHCVNPRHLQVVTPGENVLRGIGRTARQKRQTHCKRGHPLSGANVYVYERMRHCLTCRRLRAATAQASDPERARTKRRAAWQRFVAKSVATPRPVRSVCGNGHAMTPENTYTTRGLVYCRTCRRENDAVRRARLRAS